LVPGVADVSGAPIHSDSISIKSTDIELVAETGGHTGRGLIIALLFGVPLLAFATWWVLGSTGTEVVFRGSDAGHPRVVDTRTPRDSGVEVRGRVNLSNDPRVDAGPNLEAATASGHTQEKQKASTTRKSKRKHIRQATKLKSAGTDDSEKRKKVGAQSGSRGCAVVDANPWADVYMNGTKRGTTPIPCLSLPVGTHTLELKNPALGQSTKKKIRVKANSKVRVFAKFR